MRNYCVLHFQTPFSLTLGTPAHHESLNETTSETHQDAPKLIIGLILLGEESEEADNMFFSRELSVRVMVDLRIGTSRFLEVLKDGFFCLVAQTFLTPLFGIAWQLISAGFFFKSPM